MRTVKPARLIVLSLLLGLTALLTGGGSGGSAPHPEKRPLQQAFSRFGTWQKTAEHPMEQAVVQTLDLDDYLFRSYGGKEGVVNLYVGYYHTAKKVGAAHDPLVCFTGQGWEIDGRGSGSYAPAGSPALKISYSTMVAQRQGEREVIVYWFQVNSRATATTHAQKMAMLLERLSGKGEENAFVRLTASVGDQTPEAARRRIFDFIDAFYPDFHRYVIGG